jgi:Heterokaryon incompatibility protein (HET)
VTTNLESALRHLRLKNDARRLWIDAICINQSDILERNHQVKNMKSIYSAASKVLAWLGKWTVYSHQGLKTLKELMTRDDCFEDDRLSYMQRCLGDILNRDYWERIWVIQEIVIAKRAFLLCGPFLAEIPTSGCLNRTIRNSQRFQKMQLLDWDIDRVSCTRFLRILHLQEDRRFSQTISSWELVWQFRHCKSHDPRVVFALLGLASDLDVAENPADYALNIGNVKRRIVCSYILQYRNLIILNYINQLSTTTNHAS